MTREGGEEGRAKVGTVEIEIEIGTEMEMEESGKDGEMWSLMFDGSGFACRDQAFVDEVLSIAVVECYSKSYAGRRRRPNAAKA